MKNRFFLNLVACGAPLVMFADSSNPAPRVTDPYPSVRFAPEASAYVSGELVYFKPLVEETTRFLQTGYNSEKMETKQFRNVFKPGVRLALGWNTSHDGWDVAAIYTSFNYNHANTYKYLTYNHDSIIYDDNGILKHTNNYNLADLDLGRIFQISTHLNARPHAGVRGLWLTQKSNFNYFTDQISPPDQWIEEKKIKSTLVGLELGLDLDWKLSKEFAIYTNGGFAALVNSQSTSDYGYYVSNPTEVWTDNQGSSSRVVPCFDIALGLRWDRSFSNQAYHLGINLGYELHCYMDINSFNAVQASSNYPYTSFEAYQYASDTYLLTDSDYTLEGICFGLRFDF